MKLTFRFSITAERSKPPEEPTPEGDNFTQAELARPHTMPELQAGMDRQSLDDDDSGTYRRTRRRVGF